MKRTYFVTCPYCKANLDPNERCDCGEGSEINEKVQDQTISRRLQSLEAEEHRERVLLGGRKSNLSIPERS